MIVCEHCKSPNVNIVEFDSYGDDALIRCLTCQSTFTVTKDEIKDNEHQEN